MGRTGPPNLTDTSLYSYYAQPRPGLRIGPKLNSVEVHPSRIPLI